MNIVRSLASRAASVFGFELTSRKDKARFPVEASAEDQAILQYVMAERLSMATPARLFATLMSCNYVCERRIPGDFVECGVWRGGNSLIAADVFTRLDPRRTVHLFDTFEGMTEPTSADVNIHGKGALKKYFETRRGGGSGWCYASLDDVRSKFLARGYESRARFIAGDVVETLARPENIPSQIAVLRLDTDWYESTRMELEVLWPRVSIGGVLLLDDYGHWQGARRAVDEYFAARGRPLFAYNDYAGRIAVKLE